MNKDIRRAYELVASWVQTYNLLDKIYCKQVKALVNRNILMNFCKDWAFPLRVLYTIGDLARELRRTYGRTDRHNLIELRCRMLHN